MKVSCLQENLSKGLSIVSRAVATKTTLPITNNIYLATDQARLKLAATNLEIAITCWIGAKVEEEGAITIPARLLTEFVGTLPNEKIDMDLSARTKSLHLQCARFEARMNGLDAEDFPPIPTFSNNPTAKIDPESLHNAIRKVVFAAATDDSRPVLTGVYAKLSGNELTLAAADGFRLAVHTSTMAEPVTEEVEVIIPARTLAELNRIIGDEKEPIEIIVTPNRNQIVFHLSSVDLVSQLIPGTFPNYKQLIPSGHTSRVILNTAEFLKATKTASIFARDSSGIIRLQTAGGTDLSPGKLSVSARAEEVGDNIGEIDAIIEGEQMKIAFNAKYLADVLAEISGQQVALETNSPSSPGAFRPTGSENYLHVVMPMFVQW